MLAILLSSAFSIASNTLFITFTDNSGVYRKTYFDELEASVNSGSILTTIVYTVNNPTICTVAKIINITTPMVGNLDKPHAQISLDVIYSNGSFTNSNIVIFTVTSSGILTSEGFDANFNDICSIV